MTGLLGWVDTENRWRFSSASDLMELVGDGWSLRDGVDDDEVALLGL